MNGEILSLKDRPQTQKSLRKEPAIFLSWLPFLTGGLGMIVMMGIYVTVVSLAQGWAQMLDLLNQDKFLVIPITLGFGIQVGLYTFLRILLHRAPRGGNALTGASGGTSTAAMVACCAHRVADALPLLGLTAAANFLAAYKTPFMAVGLATTLAGIGFMLVKIVKARKK